MRRSNFGLRAVRNLVRLSLLIAFAAGAVYVWTPKGADEAVAEQGRDRLRTLVVAKADELRPTHGQLCAEVVTEDFLEPCADTELAKKAPLPSQITALVARERGGNAGFSEEHRTGVNVVLKSDLARQEVDKVAKHIVAEYIDVRRIGQGSGLRWEIVRSELLDLCSADASPRSP